MTQVTKESLAQLIAELESQPHLSLKEERYLDVCRELANLRGRGRQMPRHEYAQMVNELRDVPAIQSKRELIVGVLRAFNIRPKEPE